MKNFFVALIFSLSSVSLFSQSPSLTIQDVEGCPGSEILVSLQIEDFFDVGALTLFVGYDTLELEFIGVENINGEFGGLLYNPMTFPEPQIGFSWTGIQGANVPGGTLCDVKFLYSGGETDLNFNPGCEITNTELEVIPVDYVNGSVVPSIIIVEQPQDQEIFSGEDAVFTISASGVDSFKWQVSTNGGMSYADIDNSSNYLGTETPELTVIETPPDFDGNLYRCRLMHPGCELCSESALLSVAESPLTQSISLKSGWNSFSTYLFPEFPEFESLLASIAESVILVSDGTGVYYPANGINTIGDFDPEKGYIIKLADATDLQITGYPNENKTIQIPEGWSFLPVLSACDLQISEIFDENPQQLIAITEIAGLKIFWPDKAVETLQVLQSGRSYLINASSEFEITFPECE